MTQKVNSLAIESCENSTFLEGRLDNVPVAQQFVASALAANGVEGERICRAELVLEELFRNVVLHGYGGDSARPVWLHVHGDGFTLEDEAPAFDPLHGDIVEDLDRIGGAGLPLIRQLGRAVSYVRIASRNRISVLV